MTSDDPTRCRVNGPVQNPYGQRYGGHQAAATPYTAYDTDNDTDFAKLMYTGDCRFCGLTIRSDYASNWEWRAVYHIILEEP